MKLALIWALLAASLVAGLAAVVRMAGPAAEGLDEITGVIRLPELVTDAIVALFALAALVFLLDLVRRMRTRRKEDEELAGGLAPPRLSPWMRTIAQLVSLLNVVLLAYMLWRRGIPFAGGLLGQGVGSAIGPTPDDPVVAPPLFTWTFGVLALAAGLGALALAVWVAFSDRAAEWWQDGDDSPLPPLAEAVEDSLEDLRAEPDARRAIIRCYARFERAAADSGLARKPWLTPMEFMREALERLPVPRGAVPALTSLFELARFSHRPLGPSERDRALDALDEIKVAIETERADARAR